MKTLTFLTRAALLSSTLLPLAFTTMPARSATYTVNGQSADGTAPIGVSIDGQMVNVGSVAPVQANNRVLVPLRGVLEAMGATVAYDDATGTVLAQRGRTQLSLRIGSTQALVNGRTRTLDVPAQTLYGRTLVPLRFVAESLGANVSWDDAQRVVFIQTNPAPAPAPPPTYAPPPPIDYPTKPEQPRVRTVDATVTRNLPGRRFFEVITDRGELLEVRSSVDEPSGLSANDRVRLRGRQDGDVFYADSVDITYDVGTPITATGTVSAIISSTRLLLRDNNGHTFSVATQRDLPVTLGVGDRIRVPGTRRGDHIDAQNITLIRSSDITPTAQNVDFRATVTSIDTIGRVLQVRGDNGTIYVVRYFNDQRFDVGERIRIIGTASEGITNASRITRL